MGSYDEFMKFAVDIMNNSLYLLKVGVSLV